MTTQSLLSEAIALLERKRDHLILRPENQVKDREIDEFIGRARQ